MSSSKKKYYVVWKGKKPGVYDTWAECHAQIYGFPGAAYKSFQTSAEAEAAFRSGIPEVENGTRSDKSKPVAAIGPAPFDQEGICVDAACSGNPGPMEYQGVSLPERARIFHKMFPLGTNNIGEFLGIVHALAYLQQRGLQQIPIYSDSEIAIKWVKGKKCKTTLPEREKNRELLELVQRAEDWLSKNTYSNPVLKWQTESWGEIPADFGRK